MGLAERPKQTRASESKFSKFRRDPTSTPPFFSHFFIFLSRLTCALSGANARLAENRFRDCIRKSFGPTGNLIFFVTTATVDTNLRSAGHYFSWRLQRVEATYLVCLMTTRPEESPLRNRASNACR